MLLNHKLIGGMSPIKLIICLGICVTAGFSVLSFHTLNDAYRRDYDVASMSAKNLVVSITTELARNIELYDLSLAAGAENIYLASLSSLPSDARQMILFDRSAATRDLSSIKILDAGGDLLAESRQSPARKGNYAARPYFQFHKANSQPTRHISGPWVTPRGEYVLGISRRIDTAGGKFNGVAVGTMRLSHIHDLFRKLKLDEGDALFLGLENGTLVMRAPFDIAVVGKDLSDSPVFKNMMKTSEGEFEMVSHLDGIRRLYVHQRVGDTSLRLSYGVALDKLSAAWWQRVINIGMSTGLLCLVNLVLVGSLSWSLKQKSDAEQQLSQLAKIDALTGIFNRRVFEESLLSEWSRAQRRREPLSVLMIDADHFKNYNDTYGHRAGDRALIKIAKSIIGLTERAGECCARYGGEEFALILPNTTSDQAEKSALLIRERLSRERNSEEDRNIPTVSIGIATLVPHDGTYVDDLVNYADTALYNAKAIGRDCSVTYKFPALRLVA